MQDIDFDMRRENLDESCDIINSDICYWMSGRMGCAHCYVRSLKGAEKKTEVKDKWLETLALLPDEIDDLHDTGECQFCKGEKQKADTYAFVEMANPDPYYEKGIIFGFGKKVRTPVGSLMSIQASACKDCRRRIRMLDYSTILLVVAFMAAAIIMLMFPQISVPMGSLFAPLPIIFIGLMGLAGYMVGRFVHSVAYKNVSEKVKIDFTEIPLISKMLRRNWFFFQTTNNLPRVSFSRHKMYDYLRRPKPQIDPADDDYVPLDNMNI